MGYCCVAGCKNSSSDASLFGFPDHQNKKDMFAKWKQKVKMNRKYRRDYTKAKVCEDHFEDDCFTKNKVIARTIGCNLLLKPDAVPTIFPKTVPKESKLPKRKSWATLKRSLLQEMTDDKRHEATSTSSMEDQGRVPLPDLDDSDVDLPSTPNIPGNDVQDHPILDTPLSPHPSTSTGQGMSTPLGRPKAKLTCDSAVLCKPLCSPVACQTMRQGLSKGVQCNIRMQVQAAPVKRRTIATQVFDHELDRVNRPCKFCNRLGPSDWEAQSDEEVPMEEDNRLQDPDWTPEMMLPEPMVTDVADEESVMDLTELDEDMSEQGSLSERKFLVFGSALKQLLQICPVCSEQGRTFSDLCRVTLKQRIGSMIIVKRLCPMGHHTSWRSQPEHERLPLGNIAIAASILFSGSSPAKVLNAFRHMNTATISYKTYLNIQSLYLIPATLSIWQNEQERLFTQVISSEAMKLGGDARCCSPGHTAKYGSYSLMELTRSKVIHFELIQSNEVKNSYAMELEGLQRAVNYLEGKQMNIMSITTDRHSSVKCWMKEHMPDILHWFDVCRPANHYEKIVVSTI